MTVGEHFPLQVFGAPNLAGKMAALYVKPESGIKSVNDLVGHTVATTRNTVAHIFMQIAFKQAGIDPASVSISFLDPNALVAGYVRGDLEAVWMFASVGAKLMSNGAQLIESTSAVALGLEDQGNFIADANFIRSNQDTLRKFLAAVDEATPITKDSREASLVALEKGIGLVGEQPAILMDHLPHAGVTSKQLQDPNFVVSLRPGAGMTRIFNEMMMAMVGMGILSEPLDPASLVTDAIVAQM